MNHFCLTACKSTIPSVTGFTSINAVAFSSVTRLSVSVNFPFTQLIFILTQTFGKKIAFQLSKCLRYGKKKLGKIVGN